MKKLFELLTHKDKNFLLVICLFLLAAGVFDLLFASAQKTKYYNATDRISKTKAALQTGEADLERTRDDWNKWSRTARDLENLKENFLYKESNILTQARLDLEKMFRGRGIPVPPLEYGYEEFEKEKIYLVRIRFIISENYSNLRQFIYTIETFPRFLILEKVDFLEVDVSSGILKLRITIAGYYE